MALDPFLAEMESLLRVNMLFNWISGDYGPIDDFKVTHEHILECWVELLGDSFYPFGVFLISSLRLFTMKEMDFWDEMRTGDYRVFPSATKKPKVVVIDV